MVVTDHWGGSALDSEFVYVESLPPEGTIFAESFDSEEEFDFSKDWTYSFKKYSPDLRIEENSFPGKEDGIRYVVKVGIDYKFQVSQNGVITTFLSMNELSEFWQMNVQSESEFDVEVKFKPELVFNWNFCSYQGQNYNRVKDLQSQLTNMTPNDPRVQELKSRRRFHNRFGKDLRPAGAGFGGG